MTIFDFRADYIFENARIRLEPLQTEHVDEFAVLAEDSRIWTYLTENGQRRDAFSAYFQQAMEARKQALQYPFAIVDKTKNCLAGMTRLYAIDPQLNHLKMGHTWYGTAFWGSGVNQQAKYLLFDFVFEQLAAVRVGFGVHAENTRSLRALERLGVKREGILRDFLPAVHQAGRADLILLSLLRGEWLGGVKEKLARMTRP